MPQLVLQRRPKNINKASLWVEGFVVAQAPAVATYLNQRYLAPFGAPIGHISILIAEGVAGLWADAKELTKASKRVYLDANGSRSLQHALSLVSSADPECLLLLGTKGT
jgi:hypothetical protein